MKSSSTQATSRLSFIKRPVTLSNEDIRVLINSDIKVLRTAITHEDLGGARFEYDENHDPVMGIINNKLGAVIKKPISTKTNDTERRLIPSPFGEVGCQLVVNEQWRIGAYSRMRALVAIDYRATPEIKKTAWVQVDGDSDGSKFRTLLAEITAELKAKGIESNEDGTWSWEAGQAPLRWHSATSMPEWASRLKLLVTSVRLEPSLDNVFNWEFVTEFELLS